MGEYRNLKYHIYKMTQPKGEWILEGFEGNLQKVWKEEVPGCSGLYQWRSNLESQEDEALLSRLKKCRITLDSRYIEIKMNQTEVKDTRQVERRLDVSEQQLIFLFESEGRDRIYEDEYDDFKQIMIKHIRNPFSYA
jgi:hypothetical protein